MVGRMRLREIRDAIEASLPFITDLRAEPIELASGTGGYRVLGLQGFVRALDSLHGLPIGDGVKTRIARLKALPVIREGRDGPDAPHLRPPAWAEVDKHRAPLLDILPALLSALNAAVPPAPDGAFAVRLPESRGDFGALERQLSVVDDMLGRPVHHLTGEAVEVVGVDRGSTWVEFVLGVLGLPAANLILGAIKQYREDERERRKSLALVEQMQATRDAERARAAAEDARRRSEDATAAAEDARARAEHERAAREASLRKSLDDLASYLLQKHAGDVIDAVIVDDASRARVTGETRAIVVHAIEVGAKAFDDGYEVVRLLEPGASPSASSPASLPTADPRRLGPGDTT